MDRCQANNLEPIEGETIHEPLARLFGLLLFSILLVPVGLLLLWAGWWTDLFVGNRLAAPSLVALFGAVLLLGGTLGTPLGLLWLLRRGRLLLGTDRLQYVVGRRRVVVQIPFHNIAKVELVQEAGKEKYIGIDLADPKDPDTWCPNAEFFKKWRVSSWHYQISIASLAMPLEQIYERLRKNAPAV
jgi:hypothetical protein